MDPLELWITLVGAANNAKLIEDLSNWLRRKAYVRIRPSRPSRPSLEVRVSRVELEHLVTSIGDWLQEHSNVNLEIDNPDGTASLMANAKNFPAILARARAFASGGGGSQSWP